MLLARWRLRWFNIVVGGTLKGLLGASNDDFLTLRSIGLLTGDGEVCDLGKGELGVATPRYRIQTDATLVPFLPA